MKQENDDRAAVERLHRLLTEQLQRRRPGGTGASVTVAEIYQELVPYRTVRQQLGFAETEQYEWALLRLLAGEGDLVQLEPREARDEIRREVRASHPNVTRYREYAACDVIVRPPRAVTGQARTGSAPSALEPWYVDVTEDEESAQRAETDVREDAPDIATFALVDTEAELAEAEAPASPAETANETEPDIRETSAGTAQPGRPGVGDVAGERVPESRRARCAYCDSSLPAQRSVRYCPYCGADQTTRPCTACGEPVEPNWVFCVTCGASTEE